MLKVCLEDSLFYVFPLEWYELCIEVQMNKWDAHSLPSESCSLYLFYIPEEGSGLLVMDAHPADCFLQESGVSNFGWMFSFNVCLKSMMI